MRAALRRGPAQRASFETVTAFRWLHFAVRAWPFKRLQDSGDRGCLPLPLPFFAVEPLPSPLRQHVILCPPVILGLFPLASDQPVSLQPLNGHKQRTRINPEHALAH